MGGRNFLLKFAQYKMLLEKLEKRDEISGNQSNRFVKWLVKTYLIQHKMEFRDHKLGTLDNS